MISLMSVYDAAISLIYLLSKKCKASCDPKGFSRLFIAYVTSRSYK